MKQENSTHFSIVLPVFNESGNLILLNKKIIDTLLKFEKTFEIIYVDDGSTDDSLSIIRSLSKTDTNIKGIFLSRNFGHQTALTVGLEY